MTRQLGQITDGPNCIPVQSSSKMIDKQIVFAAIMINKVVCCFSFLVLEGVHYTLGVQHHWGDFFSLQ